jgi:hypothetical protein
MQLKHDECDKDFVGKANEDNRNSLFDHQFTPRTIVLFATNS